VLLYNYNTPSQFDETVQVLDDRKVKYVVALDADAEETSLKSLFPSTKRMRPDQFIIEPYLESHYKLVKEEDGVRLMERKDEDHAN
jgi:hypothetical protein